MQKHIVLMRHGKALQASEGQDDFERELSEAGKRSLAAFLPEALDALPLSVPAVTIFASPAARARQTAELLEGALKSRNVKATGDIVECKALWEQDLNAFLAAASEAPTATVFAVGHNPFVEDAIERLCGARIPCATGSLASFELSSPTEEPSEISNGHGQARLARFVQGPISQRWKTLVKLEDALHHTGCAVQQRRQAFLDDPADVETLHKLRVSIRTLRSLVSFLRPWQDATQNARLQADLKGLVAVTSRQRELDVFAEQAQASAASTAELAEYCKNKASEERSAVVTQIGSKAFAKKLNRALGQVNSIKWKKDVRRRGLASTSVREHFDSMAAQIAHEVEGLALSDAELTHDVRKRAKRVRYAAEKFQDVLGVDAIDVARGMTAHQDNLGAICDARVNIQLANDFIAEQPPEAIAWDLSLLRAQNETFLYTALKSARPQ